MRQLVVWLGFALGYQIARGLADRGPGEAFRNAGRLLRLEERLGGLPELRVERYVLGSGSALVHIVDWTYWLAQFAVVGSALLWVYLRHNHGYRRLRNTIIVANTIGLACYVALPVAPPRLFPQLGFVDTLGRSEILNHGTGVVQALANPYAAMPSLHAADALIVGGALAAATRSRPLKLIFLFWPFWVCFSLLATANHYWLDVAAGAVLAAVGAAVTGGRGDARRRLDVGRARFLRWRPTYFAASDDSKSTDAPACASGESAGIGSFRDPVANPEEETWSHAAGGPASAGCSLPPPPWPSPRCSAPPAQGPRTRRRTTRALRR